MAIFSIGWQFFPRTIRHVSKAKDRGHQEALPNSASQTAEAPNKYSPKLQDFHRSCKVQLVFFFLTRKDAYENITLYYVERIIKGNMKTHDCII